MDTPEFNTTTAKRAVVTVDGGRGFVIEHREENRDIRLVVTAAHCLPQLPPPVALSDERTYANLLAALDASSPTVWAECVFADPVADLAVLGGPDDQAVPEAAETYQDLTDRAACLELGKAPWEGRAWLLTLSGAWSPVSVELDLYGVVLWMEPTDIENRLSGSPILADDGTAVAVLSTLGESIEMGVYHARQERASSRARILLAWMAA